MTEPTPNPNGLGRRLRLAWTLLAVIVKLTLVLAMLNKNPVEFVYAGF